MPYQSGGVPYPQLSIKRGSPTKRGNPGYQLRREGCPDQHQMGDDAQLLSELRAENARLREENPALKEPPDGPPTLDSIALTLNAFIGRTDHALHHHDVDEIADEVQAPKDAEENMNDARGDRPGPGDVLAVRCGRQRGHRHRRARHAHAGPIPQDWLNKMLLEIDENNNGVTA